MIIFRKVKDITDFLQNKQNEGVQTAFVPTMGALHAGHISLLQNARGHGFYTISSIFVNPTQFNNPVDFDKYPSTIAEDIRLLEQEGCQVLFLPDTKEMYPQGLRSSMHYELGYLEKILEGKYRPDHFQGVCQAVHRLLNIVDPDFLFLGQKDYQQCMVIAKMIELTGLKTRIIICPTQREQNGLAMSSRNMRLVESEKIKAAKIYEALHFIQTNIQPGDLHTLKNNATSKLHDSGFKVDYVEIATADTLASVDRWDGETQLVALAAVYLNEVRLIDNLLITNQ